MRLLFVIVALCVAAATPSSAADLQQDQVQDTFVDWTGVYLGAHTAYGLADAESDVGADTRPHDPYAGAQIGLNWQIDQFVFGPEADFSYADLDGDKGALQQDVDNLFSLRARLGYAMGHFLPFATAGVAWADSERSITLTAKENDNLRGWVAGVGADVAITRKWSARLEYLHYDFGDTTYQLDAPHQVDISIDAIRAGINRRF
jgi:outer membrane immunogenic protein